MHVIMAKKSIKIDKIGLISQFVINHAFLIFCIKSHATILIFDLELTKIWRAKVLGTQDLIKKLINCYVEIMTFVILSRGPLPLLLTSSLLQESCNKGAAGINCVLIIFRMLD